MKKETQHLWINFVCAASGILLLCSLRMRSMDETSNQKCCLKEFGKDGKCDYKNTPPNYYQISNFLAYSFAFMLLYASTVTYKKNEKDYYDEEGYCITPAMPALILWMVGLTFFSFAITLGCTQNMDCVSPPVHPCTVIYSRYKLRAAVHFFMSVFMTFNIVLGLYRRYLCYVEDSQDQDLPQYVNQKDSPPSYDFTNLKQ